MGDPRILGLHDPSEASRDETVLGDGSCIGEILR